MKSNAICPITNQKIDENTARFNGAITLLFLVSFVVSANIIPIIILGVDFAFRSGRYSRLSFFSFISRKILKSLALKPRLINAGPKIFAARIGLFFNLAIIIILSVGLSNLLFVITGIFALCALLESAVGFCVACQIYPLIYGLFSKNKIQKYVI